MYNRRCVGAQVQQLYLYLLASASGAQLLGWESESKEWVTAERAYEHHPLSAKRCSSAAAAVQTVQVIDRSSFIIQYSIFDIHRSTFNF